MAPAVLANFIDADKWMKGVQIGDREIKLVSFADDITIFLRDITYLNRIQVIKKGNQEDSSSKMNFIIQALQAVTYKNKTEQPEQRARSKFSVKMVMLIL